jgi:hypothetical protein
MEGVAGIDVLPFAPHENISSPRLAADGYRAFQACLAGQLMPARSR